MRINALIFVVALFAGASAHAQAPGGGGVPPVPPDVAEPPADAEKSQSGLISKMLSPGDGEKPLGSDIITVHYTGWTTDGKMFDTSRNRDTAPMFPIARVLPGWRECVLLMTVGERRRCWVPEQLGYRGAAGRPKGVTVFDIELVETRRAPTLAPPDVKAPPEDAKRTASGLAYKILRPGIGNRHAAAWNRVVVHYTGWTTDGKMFDTSLTRGGPATLSLEEVIRGWTEGMQLMVEGEKTRFWIPEDLAYRGEMGSPRGMLVFDVELVRIEN